MRPTQRNEKELSLRTALFLRAAKGCTTFRARRGGICRLRAAGAKGIFSFAKENIPFGTPRERLRLAVSGLNNSDVSEVKVPRARRSRVSIARRFASAPTIRCRSAHLVEVRSNSRLPPVSTMRRAPAMPNSAGSLPPDKRHTRLTVVRRGCKTVTIRRDSWRSHVHRTYIAQRVQLFELQSGNVGGRGEHPSPFSGGSKGGVLFGKRIPPLPRAPTAVGQNTAPFGQKRKYSSRCINKNVQRTKES